MTKEELEKATGQELIDERDYCGVDGYYGDYLDNVNAEILKRINRLAELEKENAELKNALKGKVCKCMTYLNFKDIEEQLTKAKEIINAFLDFESSAMERGCYIADNIRQQAEDFIKE